MAATAKNWTINKAPKHLRLFGDKVKKVQGVGRRPGEQLT